jgi:hypothetical protein
MGGVAKSAGGFLGLSGGPQAPQGQFQNGNLDQLNEQNGVYGGGEYGTGSQQALSDYGTGQADLGQTLAKNQANGANGAQTAGFTNALATDPLTGSRFATDQVQNNGILGGLFGNGGQMQQAEGKLTDLNNQGFELKPEDMTLYGQTSGNIARMFGQQGNQASQDLANRGLASAPSGAAGAMFSGLAGNQNEMLANAQQQIMQQRFQNTQNQIAQQQNFVGQLGQQGANAINQQYGRQLSGAQNQRQGIEGAAGLQQGANSAQNNYGLQKSMFDAANTPANIGDFASAGAGQYTQAMSGGAAANNMNNAYKKASPTAVATDGATQ